MKLARHIAWRYLFSKKSHNAINIISAISVCGITIATIAMVCILSVFNGLTGLVAGTFSSFDPDLRITPVYGKVFDPDPVYNGIKNIDGIELTSESLEENALLKFGENQQPIILKGVSPQFTQMADTARIIIDGEFGLRDGDFDFGVVGAGIAVNLKVRPKFLSPMVVYMPKRNERVNMANPMTAFTQADVYVDGVFALNQAQYDDQMVIVSIDLVRELLQYEKEVTSIDIKLKEGASSDKVQKKIQASIGHSYEVKNRFEQQAETFRMVNVEKWITFLISAIILSIALFNVVGSLTMLIVEKTEDIRILQYLGANKNLISRIFLFEGWAICQIGTILGLIFGLAICSLQQHFGLLKLGASQTFVVDAYPVVVQLSDLLIIYATVSIIGFLAVFYPVNTLRQKL